MACRCRWYSHSEAAKHENFHDDPVAELAVRASSSADLTRSEPGRRRGSKSEESGEQHEQVRLAQDLCRGKADLDGRTLYQDHHARFGIIRTRGSLEAPEDE